MLNLRCASCGKSFKNALPYPEPYGDSTPVCPSCKSDSLLYETGKCDFCGELIYEGDLYFKRADGACYCVDCLITVKGN